MPKTKELDLYRGTYLLALVTIAMLPSCASSQSRLPVREAAVNAYLAELVPYGFSGTVLVARDNKVTLRAGYGRSGCEPDTRITSETVFDIASLSKQFTAAAILRLQEQGRLSVKDSIGSHLRGIPSEVAGITLHQLLTHTSGLSGNETKPTRAPESREQAVRSILSEGVSQDTKFQYSNHGYVLLAAVVETASGQAFENYLRTELLEPARMVSTGFAWVDRWNNAEIACGVGAYEGRQNSGDPRARPRSWLQKGPGGMLSTVEDLWRWRNALARHDVLSHASVEQLRTRHIVAEAEFLSYGYGVRLQETPRGTELIWHTGWDEAFSAVYRDYVDENVVVIFLSNASRDMTPFREVVLRSAREGVIGDLLFGSAIDPDEITHSVPHQPSSDLAGEYELEGGGRFQITGTSNDLCLVLNDASATVLLEPKLDPKRTESLTASAYALLMALAGRADSEGTRMADVDRYGFANLGATRVSEGIKALERLYGPLRRVEPVASVLAPTVRSGIPVTWLRLWFEDVPVNYRVIWYGSDEVYVLEGMAQVFERPLRQRKDKQVVSIDPVTGVVLQVDVSLLQSEGTLLLTLGDQVFPSKRLRTKTPVPDTETS